jgi:hypothetical protein
MQSHYGTWMPMKEGATIPLASAEACLLPGLLECLLLRNQPFKAENNGGLRLFFFLAGS